jgi:menaquinone-9 beta-reductase
MPINHSNYDIIIAGGGPAGSTCALALEHSGLRVLMVEKDVFPRDKICGDAVGINAQQIMGMLNPAYEHEMLEVLDRTTISKAKLYSPNFQALEIDFPISGHCIRRKDFDTWLFEKACAQNKQLTVWQGQGLKNVTTSAEGVQIETTDGQQATAKVIVGCDGAHSVVAKKLAEFKVDRRHYSGATRQYFRNIKGLEGNALEVYFLKDYLPGYFWIFPLSRNEANVGFGMLSETISKRSIDLKKSMQQIISEIPEVAARFDDAEPLETIKGFGLPLGSKRYNLSGNRFLLCGDAASLIDPFSGEGIETAMESGLYAARHIMKCIKQNDFSAEALAPYDKQVYQKMWSNFKNHYYLQRLLSDRVRLINLLIQIGNIPFINRNIPRWFY